MAKMRENLAAVDAEELAEDSGDEDGPSGGPTSPAKACRMTQSFAGFKATTTLTVGEDLSPQRFGGGQPVG